MSDSSSPWRIAIDTGGTFTDCLALAPDGRERRFKVLSSSTLRGRIEEILDATHLRVRGPWPAVEGLLRGLAFRLLGAEVGGQAGVEVAGFSAKEGILELASSVFSSGFPTEPGLKPGAAFELRSPEEAPILAVRLATETPLDRPLPVVELRLATTRGTNALLERRGARTVLFITEGFADLLTIGTQQRPDLFALEIRRPPPLAERVVEMPERLAADGSIVRPLKVESLAAVAEALHEAGFESAAVAGLHSYRRSCHEEHVVRLLRRCGFGYVASSAELAPKIGFLARAQTAVVDAYLGPVIRRYLERVTAAVATGSRVQVMTSAGGLVGEAQYRPKDSLLSGPAGGVVGAAATGRASGRRRILAFDMGGTSTDVSRFDGEFEYRYEQRVGGAELLAPALAIETVAAGGGSLCRFDGHRLTVGPESAGADPGPACYGAGGPLTLTDVNLLLGRLDAEGFEIPIDGSASRRAALSLLQQVGEDGAQDALERLLEGLLAIADERMADAIRSISLRRGYDPQAYALVAFGGAGAQHACALAQLLEIREILVPEDAAVLSARGLLAAVVERFAVAQVLAPLAEVAPRLEAIFLRLEKEAAAALAAEGIAPSQAEVRRRTVHLRFAGQESTLSLENPDPQGLEAAFAEAYENLYGYRPERRPVEVESVAVVVSARPGQQKQESQRQGSRKPASHPGELEALSPKEALRQGSSHTWLAGRWRQIPTFRRPELAPGATFQGPCLVLERHSATVVEEGWRGSVKENGTLLLVRESAPREAKQRESAEQKEAS